MTTSVLPPNLLDEVLRAHEHGLCAVPKRPGEKRPIGAWKQYQTRRPDAQQLRKAFSGRAYDGFGIITGAISGNVEMLELEGRAVDECYDGYRRHLADLGHPDLLTRIEHGYCDESPGGGIHLLYRCDEIDGSLKLARRPANAKELAEDPTDPLKVLIETRGEGAFTVNAPSAGHPKGGEWSRLYGGFDTIVTITPEERAALHEAARRCDRTPSAALAPATALTMSSSSASGNLRPGDDYNARASWDEVIVGWTRMRTDAAGITYWCRPGKKPSEGHSATTNALGTDRLTVFSTATALQEWSEAEPVTHSKFDVYATLHHRGDHSAAARALAAQGYGTPSQRPAKPLDDTPRHVDPTTGEIVTTGGCELPDSFWTARPYLAHIRDAAWSRGRSPHAVLLPVLARVSALVPHTLALPPIIGTSKPLSFFGLIVASSGVGKSDANGIAAELLPAPPWFVNDQKQLGSGEGVVELLFDEVEEADEDNKKQTVRRQVHHNAFIYSDEGTELTELGKRTNSTLLSTLRKIHTGGPLGQSNATKDRKRSAPAGSYTYGIVVAIQDAHTGELLDHATDGTPQRFAWARAIDPHIPPPGQRPDWPGRLPWEPPIDDTVDHGWSDRLEDAREAFKQYRADRNPLNRLRVDNGRRYLEMAPEIVNEIQLADHARATGRANVDALDSHEGLLRLKVAALLAILDGRFEVTVEDWELARQIKKASDQVRAQAIGTVRADKVGREEATRERLAERAVAENKALEGWRTVEAARKIATKVSGGPPSDDGSWTRGKLYTAMRRYRDVFDDALEYAFAEKWAVERDEASHTGDDRRVVEPGERRPS